jgi:peroxiredoxin
MNPMKVLSVLAAACLAVLLSGAALAGTPAPSIGAAAPAFSLTTIDGKPFSLADATKANSLVVVMFISTQCPYSNAYNDRMRDMAAAYAKKGVQFVGINSNKTETIQDAVDHAKKHGHSFTIVKDPDNKVADLYGASHTPEVYVVDKTGKLRYHGRIDENSDDAAKVTSPDLKNALDALLAGQTVAKAETKAFGCSIKRV